MGVAPYGRERYRLAANDIAQGNMIRIMKLYRRDVRPNLAIRPSHFALQTANGVGRLVALAERPVKYQRLSYQ